MVEGHDPASDRDERREAVTVSQLCNLYMEAANAGLVVGRKGTPKKASTLSTDQSRIDAHIRPLLGQLGAREVKRSDIEHFKTGVVTGKTARDEKLGFRSRSIVKGGKGAITRTLGLLGAIFAWGIENGHVTANPVRGVRRFADTQKKALLTGDQYRALAESLSILASKRDRNNQPLHSQVGIAGIRFIALSGVRRGECQQLGWNEVDANGTCIALDDTKTGFSLRPLGRAAFAIINGLDAISDFVFAAAPDGAGYKGLPGLWRTVQKVGTAQRAFGLAGDTGLQRLELVARLAVTLECVRLDLRHGDRDQPFAVEEALGARHVAIKPVEAGGQPRQFESQLHAHPCSTAQIDIVN